MSSSSGEQMISRDSYGNMKRSISWSSAKSVNHVYIDLMEYLTMFLKSITDFVAP